jgi:hypothetical protein
MVRTSLAATPKVGELQMDWLRSEDLKEEKVVSTPALTIARQNIVCSFQTVPRSTLLEMSL